MALSADADEDPKAAPPPPASSASSQGAGRGIPVWSSLALIGAALICAAPALALLTAALARMLETGPAFGAPLLWQALAGTIGLIVGATTVATLIGAGAAWLIHRHQFPGRAVFSWLLVLPLAAPAYVLAYAYGALTGPLGPAPIGLSGALGAGFVYVIAFYPYTYLATRAALATQSSGAAEAARSLGANPWRVFITVSAPMAWPAVAAGAALTAMEIAADYGAAQYFGATTLSTGVFRAWFSYGDPGLAVQLAALLLMAAGALLLIERTARGQRAFAGGALLGRQNTRQRLTGVRALAATAACSLIAALAIVAPVAWLIRLAAFGPPNQSQTLIAPLFNSLALASGGALVTLALGWIIAIGARQRFGGLALAAASAGYGAPGAVMALGGLMVMGAARDVGLIGGLGAAAALAMLIWIYAARFAAGAIGPMEAGLHAVTPTIVHAARSLGADRWRRMHAIEAPIAAPAVLAAALIVFVEILKELPATLILRPFDFDTLAVIAHSYASDDRLNAAAAPALAILLAGLAPVILLTTRMGGRTHG